MHYRHHQQGGAAASAGCDGRLLPSLLAQPAARHRRSRGRHLQGALFACCCKATTSYVCFMQLGLDAIVTLSMDPVLSLSWLSALAQNILTFFGHAGGQHRDGLPAARQPACGAPTPGRRATRRRRLCHHLHGEGEPLLQSFVVYRQVRTASLFRRGSADYWPRQQLRDHHRSAQADCGWPAAGEEHSYLWTSSQAEGSVTVHILHFETAQCL